MEIRDLGWLLVGFGVVAVVVGLLLASGWLGWFGRLPGDIRIVNDSTRIYIPITSMLLVSLVLSLVLAIVRRLF